MLINKSCHLIAEIGINHNGSLELCKKIIDVAKAKGFDSVKLQKRDLELCVPEEKRSEMRTTPWGNMSYFDYKKKIEFGLEEYQEIDRYCRELGIKWSASAWDVKSLKFLADLGVEYIKVPSDKSRDMIFLKAVSEMGIFTIVSTGGCDVSAIENIVSKFDKDQLALLHCTSLYPCPTERVNLAAIKTLTDRYDVPIGFSSHHRSPVLAAMSVALGARFVEAHITLDRAMWGTDQAMSLEPRGAEILVNSIRMFEEAYGDGVLSVQDGELKTLARTISETRQDPA